MGKNNQKVLAIIPARGGSKGVPRKNLRNVCGKPLIAYTIEPALELSDYIYRIIVSTDDEEIADVSVKLGAEVPFRRPISLASDEAPTLPLVQHAVSFVENQDGTQIDWVLLLQPTTPLRNKEDIIQALKLTSDINCDSIISVEEIPSHHPRLVKRIAKGRLLPYLGEPTQKWEGRRQDLRPKAYLRNGAIYITKRNVIMNNDSLFGDFIRPYIMPSTRSVNIDNENDISLVEMLLYQTSQT
tara:strand:- start:25447 stop:26172 length:726 start_codon:yes stop_codon:yes gene_type:complete